MHDSEKTLKDVNLIKTANVYLALSMPQHFSKHFPLLFHVTINKVDTIIIPIFEIRKLNHREVKQFSQDLRLENSRAPEPEHLTTKSDWISVIKAQED